MRRRGRRAPRFRTQCSRTRRSDVSEATSRTTRSEVSRRDVATRRSDASEAIVADQALRRFATRHRRGRRAPRSRPPATVREPAARTSRPRRRGQCARRFGATVARGIAHRRSSRLSCSPNGRRAEALGDARRDLVEHLVGDFGRATGCRCRRLRRRDRSPCSNASSWREIVGSAGVGGRRLPAAMRRRSTTRRAAARRRSGSDAVQRAELVDDRGAARFSCSCLRSSRPKSKSGSDSGAAAFGAGSASGSSTSWMPISAASCSLLVVLRGARLVVFGKPVVVDFEDRLPAPSGAGGLQSGSRRSSCDLAAAGARVGAGLALGAAEPVVIDFEDRIARGALALCGRAARRSRIGGAGRLAERARRIARRLALGARPDNC